ncbi:helix-turn-helix domain-containing protein [Paenibacillus sp. 11B]|uniref:helix-turn-helix domain-containing protein n=1 Tax=Paenibacillus sp. 11B TaxID=3060965 RepID=UPI00264DB31F|nr:helix-turn-helix domain-containing protein [Paenibacillus sp. 11B]MDN8593185.1 helix-turn-helix domain-containing protein [Paenibacillus sp. 11B]
MYEKNLKGSPHKLLYYRYRPTGTEESKIRVVNEEEQAYTKKEIEKIYIPEEEIRRFSLDKHGQPIPHVDGHMTIISNYIWDYWGHFFSAEGVALYGHLKRFCYGDKDYCWPDLKLISQKMNKSRNTVKRILGILEKYGFVVVFNVQNADKNNLEESPLYKVRKKVPFLPVELYEQLPTELRLDHDKYMQRIVEDMDDVIHLDPSVDFTEVYDNVIQKGTVVRKQKTGQKLEKETQTKVKSLEMERSDQDRNLWIEALNILQAKMTKPSFDTWLKDSFCIKRDRIVTVYSPTQFASEWLSTRMDILIREALLQVNQSIEDLKYDYLYQ